MPHRPFRQRQSACHLDHRNTVGLDGAARRHQARTSPPVRPRVAGGELVALDVGHATWMITGGGFLLEWWTCGLFFYGPGPTKQVRQHGAQLSLHFGRRRAGLQFPDSLLQRLHFSRLRSDGGACGGPAWRARF